MVKQQYTLAKNLQVGNFIKHNDGQNYEITARRQSIQFIEFDVVQVSSTARTNETRTFTYTFNDSVIQLVTV